MWQNQSFYYNKFRHFYKDNIHRKIIIEKYWILETEISQKILGISSQTYNFVDMFSKKLCLKSVCPSYITLQIHRKIIIEKYWIFETEISQKILGISSQTYNFVDMFSKKSWPHIKEMAPIFTCIECKQRWPRKLCSRTLTFYFFF